MNIIFLTIGTVDNLKSNGIYTDLLRCLKNNGHNVYVVNPRERRTKKKTELNIEHDINILRVRIGNIQKCNMIEKGISTLMITNLFIKAIKKYFSGIKFDLVIYSTPPITFSNVIKYIKKRDNAKSYLLLKDIFPQNAVDLNMFSENGIIHKYFRKKEKELYAISDKIGCMSPANVDYILKNNPEINPEKVHVNPNSMEIQEINCTDDEKLEIKIKYGLPLDKIIYIYGGNLGKPQGIPFIIDCLKSQLYNENVYFVIVGSGTEYGKLEIFVNAEKPSNIKLLPYLPKEDYNKLTATCDIGLIFLDHRFTIPNFPSRLLGYMQAGLPVLACTDPNTDIGRVIVEGGFGWWCESNNINKFNSIINNINSHEITSKKKNINLSEYDIKITCDIIFNFME